jgi:acyl-coenzyme A thioesterase PaaI-like protein
MSVQDPAEREAQIARSIEDRGDRGFGLCAACQRQGACHLGIRHVTREGPESLLAVAACPSTFAGAAEVAHGGWIAAVFDDFLGQLSVLHGQLHVTASLTVDFAKPVPIERDVHILGTRGEYEGRRLPMRAEMTLASSGAHLASAHGTWVTRDFSHYERHDEWLASQEEPDAPS